MSFQWQFSSSKFIFIIYKKNSFSFLGRWTTFAIFLFNFNFGGYCLKSCPNFRRPHTFQFTKYSNFLEDHSFLTTILHCGLRNCSFFIPFIYFPYFSRLLFHFSIWTFISIFYSQIIFICFNLLLFFTFISFSNLFQFYCSYILDLFQIFW